MADGFEIPPEDVEAALGRGVMRAVAQKAELAREQEMTPSDDVPADRRREGEDG
ncbi:hypothetical protein [Sorangium sp. So ce1024]|uniref:hypothetical protein n=1 Tax=Sorangium sp. So ce1024 TaxID=3133327 RepID=UPI003F02F87E